MAVFRYVSCRWDDLHRKRGLAALALIIAHPPAVRFRLRRRNGADALTQASRPSSRPRKFGMQRLWSNSWLRIAYWTLLLGAGAIISVVMLIGTMYAVAYRRLPPIDALTDYRPKVPLRVWSADGVLLGEFGEEKRSVVKLQDVPIQMRNAILAAEDANFYHHGGIDVMGIVRAAVADVISGRRAQGASTITMQVARNFFLRSERHFTRKIYEMAMAEKIEESMTKDRILEIYINQIYLGQHAYGFASAAQVYFGKQLADLSVGECAMLAELPKAPGNVNPLANPKAARARQHYVLGRMLALGMITNAQYDAAMSEDIQARTSGDEDAYANSAHSRIHAEYAAEMARQIVAEVFQEETYTRGLNVYTTISSGDQQLAAAAVRTHALEYDIRHGYRGPEHRIELPADAAKRARRIAEALFAMPDITGLPAAVVLEASPKQVKAQMAGGAIIKIEGEGLQLAAAALQPQANANTAIRPGAVIRLVRSSKGAWSVSQVPQVQAAFVSADASDGAVRALVGGFDFNSNKFNHVTQAWRQPGSSLKPFIYAAALEKGVMTTTLVNDAPIHIPPEQTGGQLWEPKNYEGGYEGPMTLREGLTKSRNLVSIRVLQQIGPTYAQQFLEHFGFDPERHPAYLTMALGAGAVTPWQELTAYAVFANGGYGVHPYLVRRIVDASGHVLMEAQPQIAAETAPRVLDARTQFLINSLLQDVARVGTAAKAASLHRNDVAGKTGTTNESHDAWFSGYAGGVVAIGWMGFDQPRQLGVHETGGGLALPIWIDYMAGVLPGIPETEHEVPDGVVKVGGDYYLQEFTPGKGVASIGLNDAPHKGGAAH